MSKKTNVSSIDKYRKKLKADKKDLSIEIVNDTRISFFLKSIEEKYSGVDESKMNAMELRKFMIEDINVYAEKLIDKKECSPEFIEDLRSWLIKILSVGV